MIRDHDYKILASVRLELRSFAHFTEQMTRHAGLTAQQHQILLAIRASANKELSIGELASIMLLRQHSISGMADRLQRLDLVERVRRREDRRSIALRLTAKAQDVLASLGQAHKNELRRIRPLLISLLSQLE